MLRIAPAGLVAVSLALPACGGDDAPRSREGTAAPRTATAPAPERAPAARRPFGPQTFWNRPADRDFPLDPRSETWAADLRRQVQAHGAWINTARYSIPVYEVEADQPTVRVTLDDDKDYGREELQRDFAEVPLPADARPAAGRDGSLVVWQPSTDTMWDFWRLRREDGGWVASWGGVLRGASRGDGRYENAAFGGTATALPLLGGLVRLDEMERGRIDHLLAMAIPEPKAGVWAEPAQRTDGWSRRESAIPEGVIMRLDPELDLAALDLPRPTRVLAEAAQRYGIIVRDRASVVTLYGEDPKGDGAAWERAFAGLSPDEVLRGFPWEHLQARRATLHRYG